LTHDIDLTPSGQS